MRIKFIKYCLKHDVIPQHLHTFLKQNIFFLYNNSHYNRLNNLQRNFVKAVLRLEDAYGHLNFTRVNIFNTTNLIRNSLSEFVQFVYISRSY